MSEAWSLTSSWACLGWKKPLQTFPDYNLVLQKQSPAESNSSLNFVCYEIFIELLFSAPAFTSLFRSFTSNSNSRREKRFSCAVKSTHTDDARQILPEKVYWHATCNRRLAASKKSPTPPAVWLWKPLFMTLRGGWGKCVPACTSVRQPAPKITHKKQEEVTWTPESFQEEGSSSLSSSVGAPNIV